MVKTRLRIKLTLLSHLYIYRLVREEVCMWYSSYGHLLLLDSLIMSTWLHALRRSLFSGWFVFFLIKFFFLMFWNYFNVYILKIIKILFWCIFMLKNNLKSKRYYNDKHYLPNKKPVWYCDYDFFLKCFLFENISK